jgi:hypothetical protein
MSHHLIEYCSLHPRQENNKQRSPWEPKGLAILRCPPHAPLAAISFREMGRSSFLPFGSMSTARDRFCSFASSCARRPLFVPFCLTKEEKRVLLETQMAARPALPLCACRSLPNVNSTLPIWVTATLHQPIPSHFYLLLCAPA